jgi:hypothetical protein
MKMESICASETFLTLNRLHGVIFQRTELHQEKEILLHVHIETKLNVKTETSVVFSGSQTLRAYFDAYLSE